MKYTLEELKSKPKQELIDISLDILQEKQPLLIINPEDFEIVVFANNQDIIAEWKRKITYVPMKDRIKGIYQYDLSVSILTNDISKTFFSGLTDRNHLDQDSAFIPSEEDTKIIEIVENEYNLKDKKGQVYVVERENEYNIIYIDEFFRSDQIIEKKTYKKGLITHKEKMIYGKPNGFTEID
ncbi:MAG TPA: hypothetical protein VF465_13595 [Flavobacterium sp.]|uniref:hypothetical protein n=1 Tax=Flavobacterium sp. TaxID=239 RepID=UPI002ED572EB